ncbi:hypothetical protein EB796_018552 [Bugula neritina]|uniref:PHD-type domain-containing protein n=3 Tax=Bugula neritina TaxID=10212 RepID=A0A7J7JA74_BUGNE|nr:hypothetical protein EB796_018552 [Bugula neritina]
MSQTNSDIVCASGDGSNTESEKCYSCKQEDCFITNAKNRKQKIDSKWILCDLCQHWFHALCQNLSNSEIGYISKAANAKGVLWCCETCLPQTKSISKTPNNTGMESVSDRLNKIEEVIGTPLAPYGDLACAKVEVSK